MVALASFASAATAPPPATAALLKNPFLKRHHLVVVHNYYFKIKLFYPPLSSFAAFCGRKTCFNFRRLQPAPLSIEKAPTALGLP